MLALFKRSSNVVLHIFYPRLAQEGALMTIPFLGKRMVYPTKKDLQTLLLSSDIDHPPLLTEMEPDTIRQLEALETGSVAFIYEEPKGRDKLISILASSVYRFALYDLEIIIENFYFRKTRVTSEIGDCWMERKSICSRICTKE